MQPLPTPCPADQVPDATAVDAFNTAYRQAKRQNAVFVAVESQGRRWTVQADALTAGPVYFVLYDVETKGHARELAAALHAALYGDLRWSVTLSG
ncbi:hypothetical protein [Streptomyces caniscabiei]|uniref:hypothetical protein n=1 Tax=Streptomyces caniscabiei TaxID=2746961 RepID=UPI0038F75791